MSPKNMTSDYLVPSFKQWNCKQFFSFTLFWNIFTFEQDYFYQGNKSRLFKRKRLELALTARI